MVAGATAGKTKVPSRQNRLAVAGDAQDSKVTAGFGNVQVTDVTEEDFETTEGESVDLYDTLMEMTGWTVTDGPHRHLHEMSSLFHKSHSSTRKI